MSKSQLKSLGLEGVVNVKEVWCLNFLFSTNRIDKEIQYDKMAICQFIVAMIISGLIITLRSKKPEDEGKQ